jgi:HK97 family phage portal protein
LAGFLDALRAFFSPPPGVPIDRLGVVTFEGQERALTFAQLFNTAQDAAWTSDTAAGERVDIDTALRNIAVQAAIRLLVNDIGSLPIDAFRSNGDGKKELRRPGWVVEPNPMNPNVHWEDHCKATVFGMLSDGNAFTRAFPNVFRPEGIEALDPTQVDIDTFRGQTVYPVRGESEPLTPAELIHIPWMVRPGKVRGMNPIEAAKEGLGIALAADTFVGDYFGNGAVPSSWIKVPPGVDLTEQQIKDIKNSVKREHVGKRKHHAAGMLTGGAELVPFDYNNRDAQLLELRDAIVEDVARLFGIPPHMLGSQKPGAVGYASVEQRSIDYVTHAVLPIVRRIEVGYSRLLRGQSTYLRFNVEGLKRGDQNARATFYTALLNAKVLRREEVRALEDLPFDQEGVGYLETPNNNPPEEPAGAASEE